MNKKLMITTLGIATLIAVGAFGVKVARADDTSNYPPIIENLVETFNLNEDEVETFFDEHRQERQQQMQENKEERLIQAVEDGVLTEEQSQALQEKWQEMWQEHQNEREQHREEMQTWFEEQGIDHDALREYGGFGGKMGMRGDHGGFGMRFGK